MEYDHLDYSRPGSSVKPHYHRMTDSLNRKDTNKLKDNNLYSQQQQEQRESTSPASSSSCNEERTSGSDNLDDSANPGSSII